MTLLYVNYSYSYTFFLFVSYCHINVWPFEMSQLVWCYPVYCEKYSKLVYTTYNQRLVACSEICLFYAHYNLNEQ